MIINYKGSGMSSLTKSTSLDKSFYRDTYFCFVFPFCFMLFRFTTFILVKIKVFLPDTELNYIVNICSFNKKRNTYIFSNTSLLTSKAVGHISWYVKRYVTKRNFPFTDHTVARVFQAERTLLFLGESSRIIRQLLSIYFYCLLEGKGLGKVLDFFWDTLTRVACQR